MEKPFRVTRAVVMLVAALLLAGPPAGAASLEDFGYGRLTVNGTAARGARPLLVILTQFTSGAKVGAVQPLAHDAAYYNQFVFNPLNLPRSVNGYYEENSHGRFYWTKAGAGVYGPYTFASSQFDFESEHPGKALGRLNLALQAVAGSGFKFAPYDTNHDGKVTRDELTIVVVDNVTGVKGDANRAPFPASFTPPGENVTVEAVPMITVGDTISFMSFVHELMHQLGAVELYGTDANRNYGYSTMSSTIMPNKDDLQTWHQDPWDKLILGWIEPDIYSLDTEGSATISAAQGANGNHGVILYSPAHGAKEYFLLEFRSSNLKPNPGYDANVNFAGVNGNPASAGSGLVIWHVKTSGLGGEQLDPDLPVVAANNASGVQLKTVFMNGSPNFDWGDGGVWPIGRVQFPLKWIDGTGSDFMAKVESISPDGKSMNVSWGPLAQLTGKFSNAPPGDAPISFYAVQNNGDVIWQDLDVAAGKWLGPKKVRGGWAQYRSLISEGVDAEGSTIFLGVKPDGALDWYHHFQAATGTTQWQGAIPVGNGWQQFTKVFSGADGIVYAIRPDGELDWYRNAGTASGTKQWTGPIKIGDGWNQFTRVFSMGKGVIYAVKPDGTLMWYRHDDYLVGRSATLTTVGGQVVPTSAFGASHWTGPFPVGTGWNQFVNITPAGNGVVLAQKADGTVLWYRHNDYLTGMGASTSSRPGHLLQKAWEGPVPVASVPADCCTAFVAVLPNTEPFVSSVH